MKGCPMRSLHLREREKKKDEWSLPGEAASLDRTATLTGSFSRRACMYHGVPLTSKYDYNSPSSHRAYTHISVRYKAAVALPRLRLWP